jgi:hypothetical protein
MVIVVKVVDTAAVLSLQTPTRAPAKENRLSLCVSMILSLPWQRWTATLRYFAVQATARAQALLSAKSWRSGQVYAQPGGREQDRSFLGMAGLTQT